MAEGGNLVGQLVEERILECRDKEKDHKASPNKCLVD